MPQKTATIERAYRMRAYPSREQAHGLSGLMGARRRTWNWALDEQMADLAAGRGRPSWIELSRRLTAARKTPAMAWLQNHPRDPLQQTLRDFDRACRNAAAGRARRPRRRRFGTVQSVRFTLDQRRTGLVSWQDDDGQPVRNGRVKLSGIGEIRLRVTEPLVGRLRSVTISRDAGGRWYACITADQVPAPAAVVAARPALGIDLGLAATACFSDGRTLAAAKPLAAKLTRLRRYQRQYTRQRDAAARRQGLDPSRPFPKGTRIAVSARMRRTRHRIGRLHAGIGDARRNHQHQVTARAVAGADVVCIESLDVRAMGRSMGRRAFRRAVADAGLGEVTRQLVYKTAWHGRTLVQVDRWYPSSKTCSGCGHVHAGLTLKDRRWHCPACGQHHHRDHNAAINIEREGLRLLTSASANTTGPDGRTPRSGGTDARGEGACATGRPSPAGQPTSTNRELNRPPADRLAPPDHGCLEQPGDGGG